MSYAKTGKITERTESEKARHKEELAKMSLRTLRKYQAVNAAYLEQVSNEFIACKDPVEKAKIEKRLVELVARSDDYLYAVLSKV